MMTRLPAIGRSAALRSTVSTTNSNGDDVDDINKSNESKGGSNITNTNSMMPPLTLTTASYDNYLPLAREAMKFIDNSPDPFHAVQSATEALEMAGFVEWKEDIFAAATNDENEEETTSMSRQLLHPGGKYYFTRNKSTLVAFAIGSRYQSTPSHDGSGGGGFKIIGSHTDSPNLKVKPYSKRTSSKDGGASGTLQLSVECYGGGLWHTWFDRDLGVSGRVFVRDEEGEQDEEKKSDDAAAGKSRSRSRIRQVRIAPSIG